MTVETNQVIHQTINGKYRIVFEKAASANKIDGFKVEVNGDYLDDTKSEAFELYTWAINKVEMAKPIQSVVNSKEVK